MRLSFHSGTVARVELAHWHRAARCHASARRRRSRRCARQHRFLGQQRPDRGDDAGPPVVGAAAPTSHIAARSGRIPGRRSPGSGRRPSTSAARALPVPISIASKILGQGTFPSGTIILVAYSHLYRHGIYYAMRIAARLDLSRKTGKIYYDNEQQAPVSDHRIVHNVALLHSRGRHHSIRPPTRSTSPPATRLGATGAIGSAYADLRARL